MHEHAPDRVIEALCGCLTKPAVDDALAREVAVHARVLSREPPETLAPSVPRLLLALDAWHHTTGGTPGSEAVAKLLGAIPAALGEPLVEAWLEAAPVRVEGERVLSRLSLCYPELGWLPKPRAPPASPPLELDTHRYDAFVAHCFDALARNAGLPHDAYRARVLERLVNERERLWNGGDEVVRFLGARSERLRPETWRLA